MVTTRRQSGAAETEPPSPAAKPHARKAGPGPKRGRGRGKKASPEKEHIEDNHKRKAEEVEPGSEAEQPLKEQPPAKRAKSEEPAHVEEVGAEKTQLEEEKSAKDHPVQHQYQSGTIERGHIYFFYRPKVELEEVHSVDDIQRFHMLLVPRPPEFSQASEDTEKPEQHNEDQEMKLIEPGADVVPARETTGQVKKPFRLIAIGKKSLPDPDAGGGGKGGGRKQVFWGTVLTVGEDLHALEQGMEGKEYETKTRGTRHQGPARLAGRGAYAIVNADARVPSDRETHLGYHLSHPNPEHFGEVQEVLGIHPASSFVIQVKNPLAPNTGAGRVGLPASRKAEFPDYIMREVYGVQKGEEHTRGRESYGLRFASVERKEMLDYEGAELLLIAARSGEEGLEQSLGEGRGEALKEVEEKESKESIADVLKELAMQAEKIPAEPLKGEWI